MHSHIHINIYIYIYILNDLDTFPNKRSFRGLGGVGGGPDSRHGPNSVRGNWPLWSPVATRGVVRDGTTHKYSIKIE